ncbi:tRNA-synt_1 domain-containing protein [Haematococcus lacustris]|uniref:tRNA-synt_1 domain-containing protein n=1 Tax=Haematococcus lacustris TaxID=44745 RepID=A0A6A0A8L3_HAELA|nr:tRNA-synt_1 domain-containing protein [Haematococcus lacustris]
MNIPVRLPCGFVQEAGVFAVVKDVFLPWYNAYRFLFQSVARFEAEAGNTRFQPSAIDLASTDNVLDKWIAAATRNLVAYVRQEMGAYRLYTVVPFLVKFIDNLTNIYVRYNRKRLKGSKGTEDCLLAMASLYHVLLSVSKVRRCLLLELIQMLPHCTVVHAPALQQP